MPFTEPSNAHRVQCEAASSGSEVVKGMLTDERGTVLNPNGGSHRKLTLHPAVKSDPLAVIQTVSHVNTIECLFLAGQAHNPRRLCF